MIDRASEVREGVIMGIIGFLMGSVVISIYWTMFTVSILEVNPSRYIGRDCQGAQGAIYAAEESDFPLCAEIERLPAPFQPSE